MNARETKRVSVVIPTRDRCDDLADCLASVTALAPAARDILVVDNASADGTADLLRRRFPEVIPLRMDSNTGFTGACNHGWQRARERGADAVLLLNDDAIVAPDLLGHLLDALDQEPDAAVVGPTIYFHDRPDLIWCAGGSIDWRRGRTNLLALYERDNGQLGTRPRRVDFVSGCCLLARTSLFDRIGGLDPRFFAYYEEVEWCVRARRAGAAIYHVPAARAWHKIDPQRQDASALIHYYMTRNRLLFLSLTAAPFSAWCHAAVENLRTLASWSLRRKWQHRRPLRRVVLRAWVDFMRGRFDTAAGPPA